MRDRDTPLYQVSLSLKLSGAAWKRGRKERTRAISGEARRGSSGDKDRNDNDDDTDDGGGGTPVAARGGRLQPS